MRHLSLFFKIALAFVVCVLVAGTGNAQVSTARPRITGPVSESSLTMLKGNVPLLAQVQFDQGEAAPSTAMTSMRLVLSRSPEQQAALDKFMAEQLDASSPNYHRWLTPAEYGRLYGPSDSDVAALVAWLQSHGFKIEGVSSGRTSIAFSGTVAQAEQAFHTPIHAFNAHGEGFLSNTVDPKIPSALAPVVSGIARLNTVKPKAQYRLGSTGHYEPTQGRMVVHPNAASQNGPKAQLSFTPDGSTNYLVMVPADVATIYNTPNSLLNANYSGTSYTGHGVTIGIGGDSAILTSPILNYRTNFLGDTNVPTITNLNGTAMNSDAVEAYLDVEVAGGLAPGADIHLYLSPDLLAGMEQAVSDNTVDIFSLSFGVCELHVSTSDNALFSELWRQAASQGIAVAVSTGDNGSAGCDLLLDGSGTNVYTSQFGLAVNALASTPFNLAVGGTDSAGLLNNFGTYATVPPGTPFAIAGSAASFYRTAKSYIPESSWNDSTTTDTTIDLNIPYTATPYPTYANIASGSGGKSSCSVNDSSFDPAGCSGGYSKPSWQRGSGVPADGARDLPDVSLLSGDGYDLSGWLVCFDYTDNTGNYNFDCAPSGGSFSFYSVGGTSAATPAFAGILALVQEKSGGRLGLAAKTLYDLYNGPHAAAIFHDITSGNNSVPCVTGSTACVTNSLGYDYLSGYDTRTGYDLATGMGSVDVNALLTHWSSAIGSGASTVSLSTNPSTVALNQGFTATVNVSGSLGEATGTVTLSSATNHYNSGIQNLENGSYAFNVPAGTFPTGTITLTASYSGDSNYASTTGADSITVTTLTPTLAVTPSATSITVNQPLNVVATLTGAGATPTGTVSISGGGFSSGPKTVTNGAYTFTIPAGSLATGSDTLTVSYSGDASYASTSGTTAVTVTVLSPTLAITPSSKSITTNQSMTVVAAVSGAGSKPTGTVSLAGGGYTSGAQTLTNGAYTFTIPAGSLTKGSDTLTVSYSGDASYAAGSGTTTVTVTALTPTLAIAPSATSFAASQSITVSATITGAGSTPTGTVSLSGGGFTDSGKTLVNGAYTFTIPSGALTAGTDTLTVTYSGDNTYSSATGTTTVKVASSLTPTISLVPSATSIYAAQPLTLLATVGGSGPTPTGKVTLSGGGYSSGAQTLANGSFTFAIPASSLAVGADTFTVSYGGDATYVAGSKTANVTVAGAAVAAIAAAPAKKSIVSSESLDVTVAVTGTLATPTGSFTISSGTFNSAAVNLAGGSATVTVPGNTLAVGSDSLKVTYNGDALFPAASTTIAVTVKAPYSLAASTPAAISKGGSALSNVTFSADSSYTGTVSLECALTSSPSGAKSLPTCAVTPSVTITNGTPSGTATVTLSSTTKAALQDNSLPGWVRAGGGAVLACLFFFGIPARRRSWRNLVGMLAILAALGGLSACGTATVAKNPGTTSGSYTFTITGMGSPVVNPAPTATVKLTIN